MLHRGDRVRHHDMRSRGAETRHDIVALGGGRPDDGVETVGQPEPARPERVHRSIRGVRRLHVHGVDRVDDAHTRIGPVGDELAELPGFADHDDETITERVRDVLEPGPVEPAEPVQRPDHLACGVVDENGFLGQMPVRIAGDDR